MVQYLFCKNGRVIHFLMIDRAAVSVVVGRPGLASPESRQNVVFPGLDDMRVRKVCRLRRSPGSASSIFIDAFAL